MYAYTCMCMNVYECVYTINICPLILRNTYKNMIFIAQLTRIYRSTQLLTHTHTHTHTRTTMRAHTSVCVNTSVDISVCVAHRGTLGEEGGEREGGESYSTCIGKRVIYKHYTDTVIEGRQPFICVTSCIADNMKHTRVHEYVYAMH